MVRALSNLHEAAKRGMAVRVICQRWHHDAHFLARDLVAYSASPTTRLDDLRFRCGRCDSRKTRARPVDLDATPSGFIVVQRLPARRSYPQAEIAQNCTLPNTQNHEKEIDFIQQYQYFI